jgi:uncharacterized protein YdeI (YjbR/CyaY-like superfamily)
MRPRFFESPEAFRAWLDAHHSKATEVLVGFHKRHTRRPSLTWSQSVDEALCYGWIDGVRRSLSEDAYTIRFTPRKTTSIWSAINVAKVEALTKAGRMQPAGIAAHAHRTPARTGVYSFERNEAARLSAAQTRAFKANAAAWSHFEQAPPWYRRTATHWVVSAKKEETRARRLEQLIAASAAGRPIKALDRQGAARPEPSAASARRSSRGR